MVNKTGAPILRVKNVSKAFGGVVCALDDVSLEVYPNEIVGVVGENGAGKTTLMKILVGIHAPDRGEWEHNGVVVPFPRNPSTSEDHASTSPGSGPSSGSVATPCKSTACPGGRRSPWAGRIR